MSDNSFSFCLSFIKLAGNENKHKLLLKIVFRPDLTNSVGKNLQFSDSIKTCQNL